MRIVSKIAAFLASVSLVACGGGGSGAGSSLYNPPGDDTGNGGVTATVTDIVLQLDKTTITSAETVAVTATAVDASRTVVASVPIKLSVDSNAVLATSASLTDAQGKVTATVTTGSDSTSRTITVTALSGNLQKTASFQVTAGGSTGAVVADIALTLDKATITNLPTNTVVATATAVDASRAALVGIPMTFSVDSKAVVSTATSATDAQGRVIATIGIGDDTSARIVTVTAKAGTLFKTATFAITGSDPTTALPVKDILVQTDKASVPNLAASKVSVTVTAVDNAGRTMVGVPVSFSVSGNGVLTPAGSATDAIGNISASVGLGTDLSNRLVTVTATTGVLERSVSFQVIGAQLSVAAVPAVVQPGSTGNKLQFRLIDSNSAAMPNASIVVTGLSGAPDVTAITGLNGDYEYTYAAPTASGTVVFNATSGGASVTKNIVVQSSSGTIPNASAAVVSGSVSANPSVVTANSTGTANQSQIRALFTGANDTRVENVRVRFERLENGVWKRDLSPGDNVVYSDASGLATASFTPGSRSSPTDGVTIRACYDAADFAVGTCPNVASTTLTVVSEALAVTIQPADKISEGIPTLTYVQQFIVMVVDSAGQAKAGVQVSPSVDIEGYLKGFYGRVSNSGPWIRSNGAGAFDPVLCGNEDLNRNGALEGGTEDANGNGKLDPRKSDVAVSVTAPGTTDASGRLVMQIEYPKSVGSWLTVKVLVAANGVSGTEGRASWAGPLAVSVDDINAVGTPAFAFSPYGIATSSPRVLRNDAAGNIVQLCTDPN